MKISNPITPVSNINTFNEMDMLFDIQGKIKELLALYFQFLASTISNDNYRLIEEVAYSLIEKYRQIVIFLYKQGWVALEIMNKQTIIDVIVDFKEKRKQIIP